MGNVKKIKLLQLQMESLVEELGAQRVRLNDLILSQREENATGKTNSGKDGDNNSYDLFTMYEINAVNSRIKQLEDLVRNSEIVDKPNSDTIGIGSTFHIRFANEKEDEEYTLVERILAGRPYETEFISLGSKLGAVVYGKKTDDVISYSVENSIISAIITGVEQKENDKVKQL